MDYIIQGGNKLNGEMAVYGAKNCALALLGATVLTNDEIVITNCPQIVDVENMLLLLRSLGKEVWRVGDVVGVSGELTTTRVDGKIANQLRGSVLVLGSILAKYGTIQLAMPGGCAIGSRPIDIHLDGLKNMGIKVARNDCGVTCEGFPKSVCYKLRFASVGATQNLICASVFSKGQTILKNCAVEPEIVALQKLLITMGAKIHGVGQSTVVIDGVDRLHSATVKVIPDRIVTATYLSAVVCAGGKLMITQCCPRHLRSFLQLISSQFAVKIYSNAIGIVVDRQAESYGSVQTAPYPLFPTDMQSLLLSMSCFAAGQTQICENLFENRLQHNVSELSKMGASINLTDNQATIIGSKLHGATVQASDLRGGAGLLVAGLGACGVTRLQNVEHVNRGYVCLAENLNGVGSNIRIVKNAL